jgi:hypothetical protein
MSASNEWTEWHLTPNGWVAGSVKTDFAEADFPTPKDTVMSCTYSEYMASAFSRLEKNVTVGLKSKDTALIQSLLKKFGECPQRIDPPKERVAQVG